jgi:tagatose 1,6-diphosphate aldolase
MPALRQFHGVAVDAGSGLGAMIRAARGDRAMPDDLMRFKRAVLQVLGPHASTVLLDATCGPMLLPDYSAPCAPMLAYEADVYHITEPDRITVLPETLTVADYPALGVQHLKFFLYYAPDDDPALNARKCDLVARVGADCAAHGLHFLMEPLVYDRTLPPGSLAFARAKPGLVRRAVETFADPRFQVGTLKIEVPVDLAFVAGYGQPLMSRDQALQAFRDAVAPARGLPIVYLSAGVPFDWFEASLHMAQESGVEFAGFMCGRSIWSDAIEVFGAQGEAAMRDWLAQTGLARLRRLIAAAT